MYQNIYISKKSEFEAATVYVWDDEKGLVVLPYSVFDYAYKLDPRGTYSSIYGEKLCRVEKPRFGQKGLYESDVSRETRVLTDLYLNSDTPSTGHRALIFDIEVSSEGGFALPEVADKEVTAIANYDVAKDGYTVFILDPENRITSYVEGNVRVESCVTEDILLTAWLKYYKELAPTIVTGWNIDGYDIPYIYNRLKRIFGRNTADSLSPIGVVGFNERRDRYQIAGVSLLDYLVLYKKYTYSQQPSYRLDYIGKVEVDMGKVEYEGTLDNLYRTNLPKFLEYNLHDVRIVNHLDKKMKLIELIRFICHLGHVQYEDCCYSSKFIEGTILTYLHRKGIICANKPEGGQEEFDKRLEDDEEGFTGAFVRPPMPGLYPWVYSLDLQSLYPSIIMSLNISPDTKAGRVHNWDLTKHMKKEISTYEVQMKHRVTVEMTRADFDTFIRTHKLSISSNGILYTNEKVGIIPEILDKWFAERVEYKGLMKKYVKEGNAELADFYDRRQHVQKILLNSIYGVLGLPIFRFYDVDNALAVTATGQDVIKTSAKFINAQYKKAGVAPKEDVVLLKYKNILLERDEAEFEPSADDHCIYIDTDSLYFSATPLFEKYARDGNMDVVQRNKELTIQIAKEMEKKLNGFYNTMALQLFNCEKHRFFIKGESVMRTGFWHKKKQYAMWKVFDLETDKDMDKIAVKGLAVVRSSTPPAFAKMMKTVLDDILHEVPKQDIDQKILTFRRTLGTLEYTEIARNTSVKNISDFTGPKKIKKSVPMHVNASLNYNKLLKFWGVDKIHMPIRDGDKVKYVFLKKNPFDMETVALKTYDDPPQLLDLIKQYIDYDAQFERELENKLEGFYKSLEWGKLPTQINQGATKFFKF